MGIEREGRSPQNRAVQLSENSGNHEAALNEGGLQIWGDVKFREDAVIRADVQGSVAGVGKVIVGEGARVAGSVTGSDVRIEGEAQGGLEARGHAWLGPKAKVKVRCHAKTLRIEPGAEFRGELLVE